MDHPNRDFFISYAQADQKWAEWIAWELESEGYQVVIQAWDFRPGGNFIQQMREAAADCRRTMPVLSPDYLESLYTQAEWSAALAADPTGAMGLLIPVRVREAELTGLDRPVVFIDLVGLMPDEARDALLKGVKRERAKPSMPPKFPGAGAADTAASPQFPGLLPPELLEVVAEAREKKADAAFARSTVGLVLSVASAALGGLSGHLLLRWLFGDSWMPHPGISMLAMGVVAGGVWVIRRLRRA